MKQKGGLRGITKHIRIAMNTIEQAVTMINKGGIKASVDSRDEDNDIVMTVRIPKL